MPDLLIAGHDRGPRVWTWRRSRASDVVGGALAALLTISGGVVWSHYAETPAPKPVRPAAYGSRPNLDLPPGANLLLSARGRAVRYDRRPSAEGLDAAVGNAVLLLCDGAELDGVLTRDVSRDFVRASVVVRARVLGVPMKERPEVGTLALRLLFRRDGYDFAADRRSGACRITPNG